MSDKSTPEKLKAIQMPFNTKSDDFYWTKINGRVYSIDLSGLSRYDIFRLLPEIMYQLSQYEGIMEEETDEEISPDARA